MSTAHASAVFGSATALGFSLLIMACAPQVVWETPTGAPLGVIDCISPAPLDDRMRAEVCLSRLIGNAPEEIDRCKRQGGTTGPVSKVDGRFACNYQSAGLDENSGTIAVMQ
ncbi:hypothetical protein [Tabrizicola sp.]|uniref:hypothetical protein n=1 Tax=Tabrizicola sp. TaxID=2005166 RepID=UPI00286ABA87|nr:hypothetical protein [Tabrizicola sp.]